MLNALQYAWRKNLKRANAHHVGVAFAVASSFAARAITIDCVKTADAKMKSCGATPTKISAAINVTTSDISM